MLKTNANRMHQQSSYVIRCFTYAYLHTRTAVNRCICWITVLWILGKTCIQRSSVWHQSTRKMVAFVTVGLCATKDYMVRSALCVISDSCICRTVIPTRWRPREKRLMTSILPPIWAPCQDKNCPGSSNGISSLSAENPQTYIYMYVVCINERKEGRCM